MHLRFDPVLLESVVESPLFLDMLATDCCAGGAEIICW